VKIAIVGGGIAGLAAARRLESLVPDAEIVLLEATPRLGGKLLTEHVDGFVIEGAADSFLSRKRRAIELCEELGLADELIGRQPENARSFVRVGSELHPLPEGLTGLIPTDVGALADNPLLSAEGRARVAAEPQVPPAPPEGDESIASFVTRRLGLEAYERLVEPLMAGIYGGDGEQLSLRATFPNLRALELEHGSVLRGLAAQPRPGSKYPPFVALRSGMEALADRLAASLGRTTIRTGPESLVTACHKERGRFALGGVGVEADAIVVATPAYEAAKVVASFDAELSELLTGIPYASSVVLTLACRRDHVAHPLDGYGYLVPASEGSDVLACTWSSSKWEGRAPKGFALLRVYLRRIPEGDDGTLVGLARSELRALGIEAEPELTRVHRWPKGMPQYVLGHPERLERIEEALERHPGLALAGAAYRGVGIPDCIESGERAAESVARAAAGVTT
jgi:protoporphyrinogen/coproporphyrinogen III oxidase